MASKIRIKRSQLATAPTSLHYGELGVTVKTIGDQANGGDRLYVGDDQGTPRVVGGKYFMDLIDHVHGTLTPNSGIIVDSNSKIDNLLIDNVQIDGSTVTTSTTNEHLVISANGTGHVQLPSMQELSFGSGNESTIQYVTTDSLNKVKVTGNEWIFENNVVINPPSEFVIDNIGIKSNQIFSKSGGGNTIYIDPYPDGLSNEGTVIIKGDLQVDGTQTTVNSSSVTVNEAIMNLGDVTSNRTVTSAAGSGVNTITLDSVVGINTGDIVAHSNIPGSTSVSSYNTGTKVVTLSANTTGAIAAAQQVTITHAYDSNTDRGISFQYNTASGTANTKKGFFGFDDTLKQSHRMWTYIPEATVTNSVVSGTKGYLDIRGIYYQAGEYNTHGITYFDANGLQTSTNAPADGSNSRTSNKFLTSLTEIVLTYGSAQNVTAGDMITQVGGTQYGVVKTTSNATTVTLIGVTGTFNTSSDTKKNNETTMATPTNVNTTYTEKPMWTDTLDGGTW